MTITLIILAVASVLFVQGRIGSDLIALSTLLALMLFGILTPDEALSGFSNPIVIMMISVFIVGGAVFRTGLARMISQKILKLAGNSETKLFLLIMLVTSVIGAFVSNTGTVAVMMPIVISLTAAANTSPSRFLMPLAFASTLGGMLTLIGTTPNLIINSALIKEGYGSLNFFTFFPVGVVCVVLGTAVLLLLSKWFLSKKVEEDDDASRNLSLRELADKYHLKQSEFRARVLNDSPMVGKTLKELALSQNFGVSIIEIRRKHRERHVFDRTVEQIIPKSDTEIIPLDVISFVGPEEKIHELAEDFHLEIIDDTDPSSNPRYKYKFDAFGIAEVVILSMSKLVGQTVGDSGFREQYGINILGIQRQKETMLQDIKDKKIQAGDCLLVQGEWNDIARLGEGHDEWVVVGQPMDAASREPLEHKAATAAIIVILMIAVMAFNILPPVTAVLLAALCLVFFGCFRNAEEAYKTISWPGVVLVAAMLPVSVAIEKTGAAALASKALIDLVGDMGPYALLAGIYAATSFVTMFLSNTATAALCVPIAMQAALNLNLSPYPFLFAVATAASMSLASPFSTPPNVLVMSPGRYSFMDYVKVGGPLQVILGIVMVFFLPLLFPFAK